jgi:DNA mismatch repair ATPase MutS
MLKVLLAYPPSIDSITEKILMSIVPNPPTNPKLGGIISSGVVESLDMLKTDLLSGATFGAMDKRDRTLPDILVKLEEKVRKQTGLNSLKIVETKASGYCFSIPRKSGKSVNVCFLYVYICVNFFE